MKSRTFFVALVAISGIIVVATVIVLLANKTHRVGPEVMKVPRSLHHTLISPSGVHIEIHTFSQGATGWDYMRIKTKATDSGEPALLFEGWIEDGRNPPQLNWISPNRAEVIHLDDRSAEVRSQFDVPGTLKDDV